MPVLTATDPVARRRGVDPDLAGSWDNVLLRGDLEQWAAALTKTGATVRAGAGVTRQALAGKLAAPKRSKWVILVELRGHPWLMASPTDEGAAESLSTRTKGRAMQIGHVKAAGANFAKVFDDGKPLISFESGDGIFFRSKAHPPGWAKQFRDDDDALLDALVRGEDAFVPGFWVSEAKGKVEFTCGQEDVLTAANVSGVALVVLASNRKEEAQKMLRWATHRCEPDNVRDALRLGASAAEDPGDLRSAMQWVLNAKRPRESMEIFELLVAAGAELNGHRKPGGPPAAASMMCDAKGLPEDAGIIALIDALHRAGADLNVTGIDTKLSPMSFAAANGALQAIKRLEALGLDAAARDGSRKLPLQRAEQTRRDCEWAPEVYRKRMKRLDAVIAYLSDLDTGKKKPARTDEARAGSVADAVAAMKSSPAKPRTKKPKRRR